MDPTLNIPLGPHERWECNTHHEPTTFLNGEHARELFAEMHITRPLIEHALAAVTEYRRAPWMDYAPPQARGNFTRCVFVGHIGLYLTTHTEWQAETLYNTFMLSRQYQGQRQLLYICADDRETQDDQPLHHLGYRPSLQPFFRGPHEPTAPIWLLQYRITGGDVVLKLGQIVCLRDRWRAGADRIAVAGSLTDLYPTPPAGAADTSAPRFIATTGGDATPKLDPAADPTKEEETGHTFSPVADPAPGGAQERTSPTGTTAPPASQAEDTIPLNSTRPHPADKDSAHMWRAGQLLRFVRLYEGRSLDKHAATLGIDADTLALWELTDPPTNKDGLFGEFFDTDCIGTDRCALSARTVRLYSSRGWVAKMSPTLRMHGHLIAATVTALNQHHQLPDFQLPDEVVDVRSPGWVDALSTCVFGEQGCGTAPIIPRLEALGVTVVGLPPQKRIASASGFFRGAPVIALSHNLSPTMTRLKALHELCRLIAMRLDKDVRAPIMGGSLLEKLAFGPDFAQRAATPSTFLAARDFLEETAAASGMPVHFVYRRAVKIRPEWHLLEQWALHHKPPQVEPINEIPLRQQLMASFVSGLAPEVLLPAGASPLLRQARNVYGQIDLSTPTHSAQTPLEDSVYQHVHTSRMRAFTNHQRETGTTLKFGWREDQDGSTRIGAQLALAQHMCTVTPARPRAVVHALLL